MSIDKERPLIKSKFIQMIHDRDRIIIWHSLFGEPKIISRGMQEFLGFFTAFRTLRSVYNDYDLSRADKKHIEKMIASHYLVPRGFDERSILIERNKSQKELIINGSLINDLGLIMSEACNFRCVYCIHFNNLEASNRMNSPEKFMKFEVAKVAIDWYFNTLRNHGKFIAQINFGGGEPLLNWMVIKRILDYCYVVYGHDFEFRFSINTNAALITSEIAEALKQYHIRIASSLDGLYDVNDRVRLTKSNKGTFSKIMRGFEILAQTNYPLDGFAMTVTEKNFYDLDESIVDWAIMHNMKEIRIDIDVIGVVEVPINDIVKRLMHIYLYGQEQGVEIFGFWSRPVENLNDSILKNNVAFCGAVRGNNICVSPSGNIYGCGYSTTELGKISEIETFHTDNSKYFHFVNNHTIGSMERCKNCAIEGQCGGGCNITQEFVGATKNTKTERMCDFYRSMTKELLLKQKGERP